MKKFWKILLLVLAFAAAIGAAVLITYTQTANYYMNEAYPASRTAQKTEEIQAYLDYYFIDDYDDEKLADAAAAAMIEATGDQWSYYLTAAEYDDYVEAMQNAYVGIGVTIAVSEDDGGMLVKDVVPDGPACEAGIETGDVITEVEGQKTLDLGINGTRALVRGEEGTRVHMTLVRDGQTLELDVERRSIETVVAEGELLDGDIGYVRISNFDERCADETIGWIEQLLAQGAKGFIFDVRFNGGGYADEMVRVLDYIQPEGDLFVSVDYAGNREVDTSDASCLGLPVAVLVNEDSYSAAEFFASSFQEFGTGVVVGAKTCGKGNFQTSFQLTDGSLINISIGKYYTPNGVSLTETGITPDIELDLSEEEYAKLYTKTLEKSDDPQLQAAIRALGENIS